MSYHFVDITAPDGLSQDSWWFGLICEYRVVLAGYTHLTRPTKRHHFKPEKTWQRNQERKNNMPKPIVPLDIQNAALEQFRKDIVFMQEEIK